MPRTAYYSARFYRILKLLEAGECCPPEELARRLEVLFENELAEAIEEYRATHAGGTDSPAEVASDG